jgi:hypothetical protein
MALLPLMSASVQIVFPFVFTFILPLTLLLAPTVIGSVIELFFATVVGPLIPIFDLTVVIIVVVVVVETDHAIGLKPRADLTGFLVARSRWVCCRFR